MSELVEEYCSHCDTEVRISNHLNDQVCPVCGKQIRPCSVRYENENLSDACDKDCEECIKV